MNFSDIMRSVRESKNITLSVPENWGQGRATFGGLVAAMMYQKLSPKVAADRAIRSIMLSFVAPIAPGDLEIMVKVLREGKAATQIQATAYQNDQECAVMLASFGGDRESAVQVDYEMAPETKQPDEVQPFPYIPNLTPDFTKHFEYRYTIGKMPFMGSKQTVMGGWIKFKEAPKASINIPEILALLDAWPPAVFSMLSKPTTGSSLTWNLSFIDTPNNLDTDNWWLYEAHIQQSANGYSHIDSTMWDERGKATVISRQTVSVFG